MTKQYLTAAEVAETLGVSIGKAYQLIRMMNTELKERGYITVSGKISRVYFEERCCYGGKAAGE